MLRPFFLQILYYLLFLLRINALVPKSINLSHISYYLLFLLRINARIP